MHTPGPWKWWTSCSWRRLMGGEPGRETMVAEPIVATDGHPDIVVSKENMALIEAAPDLLEATRCLLGWLDPDSLRDCESDPRLRIEREEAIEKARAVLALLGEGGKG
jgi:hypothetical protein